MTYMTSCGNTPCDQFDPTGAEWFKIDQLGKKPDGSTWYQADISSKANSLRYSVLNDSALGSGDAYEVALPQNLAPGGYLIRHEVSRTYSPHLLVSMSLVDNCITSCCIDGRRGILSHVHSSYNWG